MRWPWERVPWGRGRGASASDSTAGDADSPSPGSADPPSAAFQPAPAGVPAAWTRLPPLQRSISDTTAVAPPAAFRSSLTSHQNPSFLAPLGHLVDPDGPGGVVGGLASSVGDPIPYEGVDELRVPDRPAPTPGPAVQRRVATLRPDSPVMPERGDAGATDSSGPAGFAPDTSGTDTIDAGMITDAPTVGASPIDTFGGPSEPTAGGTAPPAPLVVARLADSPEPGSTHRPDPIGTEATGANQAATLGAGSSAVAPADAPSPAPDRAVSRSADNSAVPTSATTPAATPLTVPVQRSAASSTAPTPQVGDVASAAVLRPVSTTPTTVATAPPAQSAAVEPAPSTALEAMSATEPDAALSAPNPASVADLVVARSVADPADQHLDQAPGHDHAPTGPDSEPASEEPPATEVPMTGLLASRPPLVESSPLDLPGPPSPAGDSAPLTVPGTTTPSPGSGPTLQRQFADPTGTAPRSAATPASSLPSVPTTGAASPSGAGPDVATGTTTSPRVLDDLGYPPLIARSVQRRAADAEAGRPIAPSGALQGAGPEPSSTSPQAPLSGFTAAISALQDPSSGPPLGGGMSEPAVDPTGTGRDSTLVVARLLPPDQTGRLPAPQARLQRTGNATDQPAPPPGTVQRSLIAGLSPVASSMSAASSAPTTAPAVQRLRYENATGPSERRLSVEPTAGTDEPAMPAAPSSAPWSPVLPETSPDSGDWSSSTEATTSGSSLPGPPPAILQRTANGIGVQRTASGTRLPVPGTPTYPRIGEPPASLVSPDLPSSDQPPMIQRRFDAPTPSTPVSPPASADPPSMAVSGRSVGLAEMFALAAAQSSAGDATVQRSPETEVQLTSFDSGPSDSPPSTGSAAPAAPATAARPPSGAELEEMARRLYEPLSARIRAELWQDRERSGLLTDLRP